MDNKLSNTSFYNYMKTSLKYRIRISSWNIIVHDKPVSSNNYLNFPVIL